MQTVTLGHEQTLFDIAVQCLGNIERVFDLANLNGYCITEELAPGTVLILPELNNEDLAIVRVFTATGIRPAGSFVNNAELSQSGIEFWTIELDFIVT